jgi:hypothetical protein
VSTAGWQAIADAMTQARARFGDCQLMVCYGERGELLGVVRVEDVDPLPGNAEFTQRAAKMVEAAAEAEATAAEEAAVELARQLLARS